MGKWMDWDGETDGMKGEEKEEGRSGREGEKEGGRAGKGKVCVSGWVCE